MSQSRIATLEGHAHLDGVLDDIWNKVESIFTGTLPTGSSTSSIGNYAEAQAAAVVIASLIGIQPTVMGAGDGTYTLQFTGSNADIAVTKLTNLIQAWKAGSVTEKTPGVRYDFGPVVRPVILKLALPYLLGAVGVGALGMYLWSNRKKRSA